MSNTRSVQVADLREGNTLAQDIMVGSQVLLRSGTKLSDTQISRIKKLNLTTVVVTGSASTTAEPVSQVAKEKVEGKEAINFQPLPNFQTAFEGGGASWMAGEEFNQPITQPAGLSEAEALFSKLKYASRESAGLSPMMDPAKEATLTREVHAAFLSAAIKKTVNLEQVAGAAEAFVKELTKNPDGFIEFTDLKKYGEHLSSRSVLSCKIAVKLFQDSDIDLEEQVRGQLALNFAHVLLPEHLLEPENLKDPEQRKLASEALLKYYAWLRSQKFIGERTLELILLQHEHFDGTGIPYGLSKDAIPAVSETWAMSASYAGDMFSRPKSPRLGGREAADNLVANAGQAFSSEGVNRFLGIHGYYPSGSLVELNDLRNAMVVEQNKIALLKPNIRLLNQDGDIGSLIELYKEADLYILRQILEY